MEFQVAKNKMGRKAFRIWEGCYRYHNSRSRKRFQIKLASRLRANAISKVRTMASVLVNSYQEPKSCDRLIVDEALMESFWSHRNGHMACGCKRGLSDRRCQPTLIHRQSEPLRHRVHSTKPNVVTVTKELLCTYRNPMNVAYAINDIYSGTSKTQVRSLKLKRYSDTKIPEDLPKLST
ncbi:hypothetical protein EVAR_98937_1 [Eumeta japonica]|uniref:Uncharacterized protein n=1 Tax=Eumeta variegata TaxID=151549 RepID=A0A4C2A1R1_EUMVA|nr:hypothetical protein EVAR_98937_1 [Eumeta japonica]